MSVPTFDPRLRPRPTTYAGVKMRSRLEAGFAAWLDKRGCSWEYEPRAFAAAAGQYLPDFHVKDVSYGRSTLSAYIEVKPEPLPVWDPYDPDGPTGRLARRMAIIWESEPDPLLLVAAPGWLFQVWRIARWDGGIDGALLAPATWLSRVGGISVGSEVPQHNQPWAGEYWNVR